MVGLILMPIFSSKVFKTGGEAIMVHSGLHKNLPHTIFKGLQLQFLKFLNE